MRTKTSSYDERRLPLCRNPTRRLAPPLPCAVRRRQWCMDLPASRSLSHSPNLPPLSLSLSLSLGRTSQPPPSSFPVHSSPLPPLSSPLLPSPPLSSPLLLPFPSRVLFSSWEKCATPKTNQSTSSEVSRFENEKGIQKRNGVKGRRESSHSHSHSRICTGYCSRQGRAHPHSQTSFTRLSKAQRVV
ncbi:hypothetical protein IE53DRAFT_49036 [Violaceomyces palustris]|uniref:Uncharacterized protein n=1 Tax=Violaceomyces palustris TaxID=1673888 RepID=A0ACD0P069_9BASI|nr:hypothetical protein IE53DRAFT_49036 [Violaceomyces palustris]